MQNEVQRPGAFEQKMDMRVDGLVSVECVSLQFCSCGSVLAR